MSARLSCSHGIVPARCTAKRAKDAHTVSYSLVCCVGEGGGHVQPRACWGAPGPISFNLSDTVHKYTRLGLPPQGRRRRPAEVATGRRTLAARPCRASTSLPRWPQLLAALEAAGLHPFSSLGPGGAAGAPAGASPVRPQRECVGPTS